jgi:tetratricopeptide (TPR) repeat protein
MVSSRPEEALAYGERAVALATALDLPEVRAHALNNMGATQQGQPGAIPLLEESIRLSAGLNSPEEARGHHNLGVCAYMVGDIPRALAELQAAMASSERFGVAPLWRFSRSQVPSYLFRLGRWDEALQVADEVAAAASVTLVTDSTNLIRSWVYVFRDDVPQALEFAERALAVARQGGDPQGMYPSLAITAFVYAEAGDHERARGLLLELAERWSLREIAYGAPADMAIGWFEHLGTDLWRETYDRQDAPVTAWLLGARALADEDWARAVEVYETTGAVTDVAAAQLYAAEKLLGAGRGAEAELYLHPALSFFRSVRATRRVRRGEALLAATA